MQISDFLCFVCWFLNYNNKLIYCRFRLEMCFQCTGRRPKMKVKPAKILTKRWTNTNLDCAIYMVISEFGYHENWRVREV